ncbi:hypothetical protein AUL39_08560 [Tractidigestivibacter scatoligenes]|jgi:pimeloyl-ACP methyl ester carboxylesterase|uniref:Alpha/beta hydrolase n=1 Tax=Tractidigestivibacter scatoligenes TaxID=1299998 RepID=A0A100YVM5_TRASO|nr:alpha/beta hydrolase [Tractidigestivibacter scatoligenes]KUH58247.1 hypothetical protein AUL39_08560 [Tractidigestivibacter scatoligenes]
MDIFRHGEKRAEREAEEVLDGAGWHELPVRCERDGREVRARLLAPDDPGPLPVIMWAGGDDVAVKLPLEELAAHGVASCVIEDAAPGTAVRALEDLEAASDAVGRLDLIDNCRVFLAGAGRGGFVATMAAARHPRDVSGLVLLSPDFSVAGAADAGESADGIWGDMRRYRGPVLVCRGEVGSHRAFDDARRAAEEFPNARLVTLGEGPRVVGEAMWLSHAVDEVVRFIREA